MKTLIILTFLVLAFLFPGCQHNMKNVSSDQQLSGVYDTLFAQYERYRQAVIQQQYVQGLSAAQDGFRLADSIGDQLYKFKFSHALGIIRSRMEEFDCAKENLEYALELAIDNGFLHRLLYIYFDLGRTYFHNCEYDLATSAFVEALDYARRMEKLHHEIAIRNQLGYIQFKQGNYAEALNHFILEKKLMQSYNILDNINYLKMNQALCYKNLSEKNKAKILFEEILQAIEEGSCQRCHNLAVYVRDELKSL